MESFDLENFKTINTIIERDSKDTTFQNCPPPGAVEISQEYQHLKHRNGNRMNSRWAFSLRSGCYCCYPFIESDIPRTPGDEEAAEQISFRRTFRKLLIFMQSTGDFPDSIMITQKDPSGFHSSRNSLTHTGEIPEYHYPVSDETPGILGRKETLFCFRFRSRFCHAPGEIPC